MAKLVNIKRIDPVLHITAVRQQDDGKNGTVDSKNAPSEVAKDLPCNVKTIRDRDIETAGFVQEDATSSGSQAKVNGSKQLAWPSLDGGIADNSGGIKQESIEENVKLCRKRFLYKNITVICLVFLLAHTAMYNVIDLKVAVQTSFLTLNTIEHSVYYLFLILTLFIISPWIVIRFGLKCSITIGLGSYMAYAISNLYLHPGTVVPARIVMGIGAAIMWTAQGTYVTQVGRLLSDITGIEVEQTLYGLLGCFYLVYHMAEVWSALISAYILHGSLNMEHSAHSDDPLPNCGAFHCPIDGTNSTIHPLMATDIVKVYTLLGMDILLCILSVLTAVFCLSKLRSSQTMDNSEVSRQVTEVEDKVIGEKSPKHTDCSQLLLLSSWYQVINKQQLCIIPLTIYSGLQQAFFLWDFNQSYTACGLGYWMVFMTTICSGVVTSVSSIVIGIIVRKTGRIPLFVIGALSHCSLLLTIFLWQPQADYSLVLFAISCLWGVGNAVWQCLLHAFYTILFMDKDTDAAFANYHMWRNIGLLAAFVSGHFLCSYVKIFTLLIILILGMVGYFAVEVPIYRRSRE